MDHLRLQSAFKFVTISRFGDGGQLMPRSSKGPTASLYKLAAGRKLAATHLNVSNRQMCCCTGFKSGSYNKSYYNRPFKNDTGL